jgi:excinuclease UvrABC ATPase subunit
MNNTQAMDDDMYTDFFDETYDPFESTHQPWNSFEKTSKNTKLMSNEYNETKKMRDTQRKKERSMKRSWEGV